MRYSVCDWGHGICKAPDTVCPHWIGTVCELDEAYYQEYGWAFDEIYDAATKGTRGDNRKDGADNG